MSPMGLASYADKVRLAIILQNKGMNILKLYKYTTKSTTFVSKTIQQEATFHQGQHHAIQEKEQVTTTDRCRDHYRS